MDLKLTRYVLVDAPPGGGLRLGVVDTASCPMHESLKIVDGRGNWGALLEEADGLSMAEGLALVTSPQAVKALSARIARGC